MNIELLGTHAGPVLADGKNVGTWSYAREASGCMISKNYTLDGSPLLIEVETGGEAELQVRARLQEAVQQKSDLINCSEAPEFNRAEFLHAERAEAEARMKALRDAPRFYLACEL